MFRYLLILLTLICISPLVVSAEHAKGLAVPNDLDRQITAQAHHAAAVRHLLAAESGLPILESLEAVTIPDAWDWSAQGKVSAVRNQATCGSCWDFGSIAAFESAWSIANNKTPPDFSEQDVLRCSGAGSCDGGWIAFPYLVKTGACDELVYPYTALDGPCKKAPSHPYRAVSWAYVGTSAGVPSDAALATAIYQHGPVAACVYVSPSLDKYSGGIFSKTQPGSVNHLICIVGYDKKTVAGKTVWKVKNSWGPTWGEKGFFRIVSGVNKIGYAAAWIQAAKLGRQHSDDIHRIGAGPIYQPTLAPERESSP